MSIAERDKYTGHMTTGHEWNGIKELNTPVPLVLIVFLALAFLFAAGYWIMMPAWPLGNTYTRGALGFDQREHLERRITEAATEQSHWRNRIAALDFAAISKDPQLMTIVNESAPALYNDNCAMCHGNRGDGGRFFPRLNDAAWLWGSDADSILHTITAGINTGDPDSRLAIMPAFGDTGVLSAEKIKALVVYLQSNSTTPQADLATTREQGKKTYGLYCAGCHNADGSGNLQPGAPDLTDSFWIYGGDTSALTATITGGRQGYMPAWQKRLSLSERKVLTLYVLALKNPPPMDARP